MQRRDWLQRSLISAGIGLAGSSAFAQATPPQETEEQRRARSLGMLEGQEGAGMDPREIHAYSMGVQAERPSDDKLSNWLPAPKAGNFNLTMRNYMPSPEIVEQRYDPPVLTRVG